ncbi:glycoside hydrolase family 68 protein [Haloferax sp. AB510]|uniref:glycoside hydrolase family 68 protein n=1 Tax=Haloferax sp. AB510 TaxID=2934172 RepID=UPI00209BD91A|nr:glycoside hydrolase family 68 protein [Haloferax sp. AB510]MCO8267478.1 glycoside hydrolase family 68 protein [Haloferax sp. AB510]
MSEKFRNGVPAWTREHAAGLDRDESNVAPVIYPPDERLDEDLHIWDTWFLRNRDGSIAEIDGYRVIFSLTSPSDLLPGKRHDVATIRYFYSRDGEEWTTGGVVFDGGALGQRQWAGSAMYDPDGDGGSAEGSEAGDVYLYYTAAGEDGAEELTYTQRIALATGGTVHTDDDGFSIEGSWDHRVILTPDGDWYEREDQSRGMIYTFRDPWFFEDPASGETYLLFEANTPVPEGAGECDDPVWEEFNGSVGIAHSPTGDPTDFELRPPLLDAVCVNQELERPHLVVRDETYYLFVSSHVHTFAPELTGYDALYGFVADDLAGDYQPLNGHGMVLTNPRGAPFQAYSWLVYDHGDDLLVSSFFNYFDYDRSSLDDVGLLSPEEQQRRFGGTLAPTVRLALDGDETDLVDTLGHGHLPLPREELPTPWWERDGDATRGGY